MPTFSIIAAAGLSNEIGFHNQLLCHLPADLRRFKELTTGHPVIMGHNTWDSLPIKPLPHRTNLVLSHNLALSIPDATVVHSISELQQLTDNHQETFVIGGEKVYQLFMDIADNIYLTRILGTFDADAFFPIIDEKKWHLAEETFRPRDEKNPYDLKFQKWVKMA